MSCCNHVGDWLHRVQPGHEAMCASRATPGSMMTQVSSLWPCTLVLFLTLSCPPTFCWFSSGTMLLACAWKGQSVTPTCWKMGFVVTMRLTGLKKGKGHWKDGGFARSVKIPPSVGCQTAFCQWHALIDLGEETSTRGGSAGEDATRHPSATYPSCGISTPKLRCIKLEISEPA